MITRLKNRFRDYIKSLIDDDANLILKDDEIDAFIEKFANQIPTTANLTAYSNKFKQCCPEPVLDLSVVTGDDDAVYVLDEWSGMVYFDPDDVENTAVAPADGDTIAVKYTEVCLPELMRDLFNFLASKTAKLTISQSISGLSLNTMALSDAYYKQACIWGSRCN